MTFLIFVFQIKRTSLWNKASDELKKHQEFVTKVKSSLPDFLKDPYGDPYVSEEMRDFASNLGDSDNENDENIDEADEEELEQIKSALEEEDGSGKYRNMLSIFPKNLIIRTEKTRGNIGIIQFHEICFL